MGWQKWEQVVKEEGKKKSKRAPFSPNAQSTDKEEKMWWWCQELVYFCNCLTPQHMVVPFYILHLYISPPGWIFSLTIFIEVWGCVGCAKSSPANAPVAVILGHFFCLLALFLLFFLHLTYYTLFSTPSQVQVSNNKGVSALDRLWLAFYTSMRLCSLTDGWMEQI